MPYIPLDHFQTTDDDLSSVRIRDMPYGKKRESLTIYPTIVAFPETVVDTFSAPYPIIITNNGYDIVIIKSIKIVGDFMIDSSQGRTILPGEFAALSIVFSPRREGHITGGVYIDSGDAAGLEFITLSGSGVAAPITEPIPDPDFRFAVWPGGALRSLKERARDTYCILDAPGNPDPTGNNDSTAALLAMAAQGIKGEITDGTFLCGEQLHLKEGILWEGFGAPDYIFHAKSKIIFFGTGARTSILPKDFTAPLDLANPSIGAAYLADSGTRGDRYKMLSFTQPDKVTPIGFSAAVVLDRAASLKNLGIYPNFEGLSGYENLKTGQLSDDWDVGIWCNDADSWRIENCASQGHWRKAALLVTSNERADQPPLEDPSSQYGQALNSYFQGFFGLSMRSPNAAPPQGGWGLAGTDFINCEFKGINYKGGYLATSEHLATPFSSPSGCVEMGGYAMRGVQFMHSTLTGGEDICMILGRAGELVLNGCYSEAKSVVIHKPGDDNGTAIANSRGMRMIADSRTLGIFRSNTKLGIDYTPWQTADTGLTRYTGSGLFNPGSFIDDDYSEIRSNSTVMGARLRNTTQTWGVLPQGAAATGDKLFEVFPAGGITTKNAAGGKLMETFPDGKTVLRNGAGTTLFTVEGVGGIDVRNNLGGGLLQVLTDGHTFIRNGIGGLLFELFNDGSARFKTGTGNDLFEISVNGQHIGALQHGYTGITPVINDDMAYSLPTPRLGGMCAITYCGSTVENSAFQNPRLAGIIGFDSGASNMMSRKFGGGDLFNGIDTDVSGVTGTDGWVTVGVIANNLRIENRTGGNSVFRYFFFG